VATNRNKARGNDYERLVAKSIGATRFPADTGNKLDISDERCGIQVRSGLKLVSKQLQRAVRDAQEGCEDTELLPVAVLLQRDGAGRPLKIYALLDWTSFLLAVYGD
jgi:hypothetical protein